MANEKNTVGFGLTSWDEPVQTKKPERRESNSKRIEFARLTKGNNVLRIITPPAKYHFIKFLDGPNVGKFGKRVQCAYPAVDKADCPTVQAGYNPKKRYMVGVIQRTSDGDQVKILDMSVLVYEAIQTLKEAGVGEPGTFDINVRFNPDSTTPAGYYTVIHRDKTPLSEADLALIEDVGGMEAIETSLSRLTTPQSVEKVTEKLKSLGWNGTKRVVDIKAAEGLEDAEDEDYTFNKPAANG